MKILLSTLIGISIGLAISQEALGHERIAFFSLCAAAFLIFNRCLEN